MKFAITGFANFISPGKRYNFCITDNNKKNKMEINEYSNEKNKCSKTIKIV